MPVAMRDRHLDVAMFTLTKGLIALSTVGAGGAIARIMHPPIAPLRLRLDSEALISNWRWLAGKSGGAACGAAIKANGYGLGAGGVLSRLARAGCRDFFVSNWVEAAALEDYLDDGINLSVLHGVRDEDMPQALGSRARPVLNSTEQIARWRNNGGGRCDVMVDTGMNRLGLDWRCYSSALLDGLQIDTVMSHLASADDDTDFNDQQQQRFAHITVQLPDARASLANSAGICLGRAFHFGLTRPGLALYGGIPRHEATGHIRPVVQPQAQILQRRRLLAGDRIGYNGIFTATRDHEIAILNLGYADGYLRGFSGTGAAVADGVRMPVLGRVSMDLVAIDVSANPDLGAGDWLAIAYDLPEAAAVSGLSQYELLTGLGARYDREWM